LECGDIQGRVITQCALVSTFDDFDDVDIIYVRFVITVGEVFDSFECCVSGGGSLDVLDPGLLVIGIDPDYGVAWHGSYSLQLM
jgi:hypothetical protein